MSKKLPEHTVGSGNVFTDAGLPDAEAHFVKAQLVSRLDDLIHERGLNQTEAARLLGLAQPDLSNVLRGKFRGYSVERLLRFLTAFGCEVDIVIRSKERHGASTTIPMRPTQRRPQKPAHAEAFPND